MASMALKEIFGDAPSYFFQNQALKNQLNPSLDVPVTYDRFGIAYGGQVRMLWHMIGSGLRMGGG